jgi:hypothetical protein
MSKQKSKTKNGEQGKKEAGLSSKVIHKIAKELQAIHTNKRINH